MEAKRTKMSKQFSYKLVWLNVIASFIIVIGHCNTSFSAHLAWKGKEIADYLSFLGIPVMGYFFFVSAYLFFRNYELKDTLRKWKSRLRTLIIPYILWNMIMIVSETLRESFSFSGESVLYAFLLPPYGPIDGPLWYIVKLFVFFLFAPLIYLVMKQKIYAIIVIVSSFCVNCMIVQNYYSIFYWLPVILLGSYIAINCPEILEETKARKRRNWIYSIGGCLIFLIITAMVKYMRFLFDAGYLFRMLAPLLIFEFCKWIEVKKPPKYIKNLPFSMYCSHVPVLYWTATIIKKMSIVDYGNSREVFMVNIVNYFIVIGIILALKFLLERFCSSLFTLLTGNR